MMMRSRPVLSADMLPRADAGGESREAAVLPAFGETTSACCICLVEREGLLLLPCCGREGSSMAYCASCLDAMRKETGRCPVCRAEMANTPASSGTPSMLIRLLPELIAVVGLARRVKGLSISCTQLALGPLERWVGGLVGSVLAMAGPYGFFGN